MRNQTFIAISATAMIFGGAMSAHASTFAAQGQVLRYRPMYQRVEVPRPRQVCQMVRSTDMVGSVVGTAVGAAGGGLVGAQFGKGSGNAAMTALGAVAGAIAGNEVGSQGAGRLVRRCHTVNDYVIQRQLSGYEVQYQYDGHTYQTRTAGAPGHTIPLNVTVTPSVR